MLKQIKTFLRGILGIGLIVLFFFLLSFGLNKAQADEKPYFLPGTLYPIQVPMACGESTTVLTQIVNGFKMKRRSRCRGDKHVYSRPLRLSRRSSQPRPLRAPKLVPTRVSARINIRMCTHVVVGVGVGVGVGVDE